MDISFKDQQHTCWEEAQYLIDTLRAWGITYLVSDEDLARSMEDQQSPTVLIARLAQCPYPRIRDASISLFLLHPELAPFVLEAIDSSETTVTAQITTLVLATLYLQRLWSIRLTLAFGHIPSFPEHPFAPLWHKYHLPAPICHDGKWGLDALQQVEQRRTGLPFNYRVDWQNQLDHLLLQIDAFYFELYSIALSKIQRGSTRDINDVRLLLQQHVITLQSLDAAYHEVLPQVGKRPYNRLDPKQFAAQYSTIRQLLEDQGH